jgi:ribonucleoside-diphosphate reductase beta chain
MLQFEQDLKIATMPQPGSAGSAAGAAADAGEFRRISVDDKRVINGQTDVNQLVPFKYKWAWE